MNICILFWQIETSISLRQTALSNWITSTACVVLHNHKIYVAYRMYKIIFQVCISFRSYVLWIQDSKAVRKEQNKSCICQKFSNVVLRHPEVTEVDLFNPRRCCCASLQRVNSEKIRLNQNKFMFGLNCTSQNKNNKHRDILFLRCEIAQFPQVSHVNALQCPHLHVWSQFRIHNEVY